MRFISTIPIGLSFMLGLSGWLLTAFSTPTMSAPKTYSIDDYNISINQDLDTLSIVHQNEPTKELLGAAISGFVVAGSADLEIKEKRGSFKIEDENISLLCRQGVLKAISNSQNELKITMNYQDGESCKFDFDLVFRLSVEGHLEILVSTMDPKINYWELIYNSHRAEEFYGFGEQFSHLNLKGQKVPVLVQEQGVGRGHPIITPIVNANSDGFSGGNKLTTYIAIPHYITSNNRSLYLKNSSYSEFDLSKERQVRVRVFARRLLAALVYGETKLDLISSYTKWSGLMKNLPYWVHNGAIIGIQGGTQKVREIVSKLESVNTPITALWLQDWVGQRRTSVGSQLWWNWELDREHYAEWEELVAELKAKDIRVLGYINPFLVNVAGDPLDDPDFPSKKAKFERNLFTEAESRRFLIRNPAGETYRLLQTSFVAGLLDLSNPETKNWIKSVIKENLIGSGLSGWMADFAEAMPFDAQVNRSSPFILHNAYAELWAQVNREAIAEAGLSHEILTFHRSGYSRSPAYVGLFWQGDQMVTWDKHDGFKSAIVGLVGGGFSGLSLNHSDIGGYAGFKTFGIGYSREENLLLRWMEANAFTAAFRTHEGNQPENNSQVYSNETTLREFARNAKIFKSLGFYRKQLVDEAEKKGWPVVRHPLIYFPEDEKIRKNLNLFMLGSEFLVCPVLKKNVSRYSCYLPKGNWQHLWSEKTYESRGETYRIKAPMGQTPVFFKSGSAVGKELTDRLKQQGLL